MGRGLTASAILLMLSAKKRDLEVMLQNIPAVLVEWQDENIDHLVSI